MSKETIKVAAAQMLSRFDLQENLTQILKMMREARDAGCEIVGFHEGALTGYPGVDEIAKFDANAIASAEEQVRALAGELGIAVIMGSVARGESDRWLNSALVIDEMGRVVGRYVKTWRAGEKWACPGTGPAVVSIAGIQATATVCHDLRYPELVRLAVIGGARLLFIVNNENGVTGEHKMLGFRSMQIARATENGIYAVMVNCAGDPDNVKAGYQSHGQSMIVDPWGNVIDQAGIFEHRLVVAELDLTQSMGEFALRTVGMADWLHDRYGDGPEHAAYAKWMKDGLALVHHWSADNQPRT